MHRILTRNGEHIVMLEITRHQGRSQDFKGGVSSVGVPAYAYICACALHKRSAHNTELSRGAVFADRSASAKIKPRKLPLALYI